MHAIFFICVVAALAALGMIGWASYDERKSRKELEDYFREVHGKK